jgi:hypothetical protein
MGAIARGVGTRTCRLESAGEIGGVRRVWVCVCFLVCLMYNVYMLLSGGKYLLPALGAAACVDVWCVPCSAFVTAYVCQLLHCSDLPVNSSHVLIKSRNQLATCSAARVLYYTIHPTCFFFEPWLITEFFLHCVKEILVHSNASKNPFFFIGNTVLYI